MKYRATMPDGRVATRTSRRAYTHAIAKRLASGWVCTAFCGSFELAAKERATQERLDRRCSERALEYGIVPVHEVA